MKKMMGLAALAVSGLMVFGACDAGDDEPVDEETTLDDDTLDEEVTVTRVELTPNGYGRVERWTTTRRVQLLDAEEEERLRTAPTSTYGQAAQAVTRTLGCDTDDWRMWTDQNYTGHQLCLTGTADSFVDLDTWTYSGGGFSTGFGGQIESYKSGDHWGGYEHPSNCGPPCETVSTNENDASFTASCTDHIHFEVGGTPC